MPRSRAPRAVRSERVAILGATGSVGRQAVAVCKTLGLKVCAVSANEDAKALAGLAKEHAIRHTFLARSRATEADYAKLLAAAKPTLVLNAIAGYAGLPASLACLSAGIDLALANKETLVVAGGRVTELAAKTKAKIYPIDSEHAAVTDLLGRWGTPKRIVLTASGGPFKDLPLSELSKVTVAQAVKHPVWRMGQKISVDSATMMNKALELIEARWLFGPVPVSAVVHEQGFAHALVQSNDGAWHVHVARPDMTLPIQRALERFREPAPSLVKELAPEDLSLRFEKPSLSRWPALTLAQRCLANPDSTLPVVLNAANEAAVALFVDGKIGFEAIVPLVARAVREHKLVAMPSLDQIDRTHAAVYAKVRGSVR